MQKAIVVMYVSSNKMYVSSRMACIATFSTLAQAIPKNGHACLQTMSSQEQNDVSAVSTSGWESAGAAESHAFRPQLSVFRICARISGSTLSAQTVKEVRWNTCTL